MFYVTSESANKCPNIKRYVLEAKSMLLLKYMFGNSRPYIQKTQPIPIIGVLKVFGLWAAMVSLRSHSTEPQKATKAYEEFKNEFLEEAKNANLPEDIKDELKARCSRLQEYEIPTLTLLEIYKEVSEKDITLSGALDRALVRKLGEQHDGL